MANRNNLQAYNIACITVDGNRGVDLGQQPVNSLTFINLGTTIATINGGIILNPGVPGTNNGESVSIGGNEGEYFDGRIDVAFNGASGLLLVIVKYYL